MPAEEPYFWSAQTLDWYLRAASFGTYHARTAAALAPFLADGGTICDLGCGPGRLSLALLNHVPQITALDRDPLALKALRQDGGQMPGLTITEADAMALPQDRIWDHLILSFFGKLTVGDHLAYFLSHCRRQLICIVNAAPKSSFSSTGASVRQKDYAPQVAAHLDQHGLRYRMESHTLDFGQPLRDMAEARAFVRRYSPPGCPVPEDGALAKRLVALPGGGLYLPHHKKIVIFIISKE